MVAYGPLTLLLALPLTWAGNGYSLSFSQPGSVAATRRNYLDPDDTELQRMAKGFTVMMWLRFNDLTPSSAQINWGIQTSSDNNFIQPFAGIHGGYQLGGNAPRPSAVGSVTDATQWHHYAQSWNAADGRRVVYVDGVELSNDVAGINRTFLDDNAIMVVGVSVGYETWGLEQVTSAPASASSMFDGEIDDLVIYAGQLSNESVATRARLAGKDLLADDCLLLYTFDDAANQHFAANFGRAGTNPGSSNKSYDGSSHNPYDLRFAQLPKPPGAEALGRKFSVGSGTTFAEALVAPSRIPSSRTAVDSTSAPTVVSGLPGVALTVDTALGPRQYVAKTDNSTLVDGLVHVVPRLPSTTETRELFVVKTTFEDHELSLQLVGSSNFAPGIDLKPVIISLPSHGALSATTVQGATSSQGIAINTSQRTVGTAGRYVVYTPLENFVGIDTFTMPTIARIEKSISEDSRDLVIRLTPSDVEDGQPLEVAITKLPKLGDLYLYDESTGAAQDGPPITQVYSSFNVGGDVIEQYISAVVNSSSFWGTAPNLEYHPLAVIGKPDCNEYGECATSGDWVAHASRPIPPGIHIYHEVEGAGKAAAYVRSSDEATGTVDIEYMPLYKRDATGVIRRCHIDPRVKLDGVPAYPHGCDIDAAPASPGEMISASVPRAEIGTLLSGVWCPLKKVLVDERLHDPDSIAFGTEFLIDHWQRDFYPPYTEYIDVAIARPVYVVRVEIGSSRGMGHVVKILTKDPKGAWIEVYSGTPQREVATQSASMRSYHTWAPSLCRTHFPVSTLRIAVDTSVETGIDDWNYIDYVKVFGSEVLQPAAIRTTAGAVIYRPHAHAVGNDVFRFVAMDCPGDPFRTTASEPVSISITAVNDAPQAVGAPSDAAIPFTLRGLVGMDVYAMGARDEDRSDTLTFQIHELPVHATLFDAAGAQIRKGQAIPMAAALVSGEIACSGGLSCPSSPTTGSQMFCRVTPRSNGTCAWCDDLDDCDTIAHPWSRSSCRVACSDAPASSLLVESAPISIQTEVCGPDRFSFSVYDGTNNSALAIVHYDFRCSRQCDRADMLYETTDCHSSDSSVRTTTWRWDNASDCDLPRAGLRRPRPNEPAGINVPITGPRALPASTTEECSSNDDSTTLIIACSVVGSVLLVGSFLAYLFARRQRALRRKPLLVWADNGQPPVIKSPPIPDGWHLFLSHKWPTGQVHVAMIQKMLLSYLPDCRCFLDVNDLADIDKLEQYIERSAVILVFLSRAYFGSRGTMLELWAAHSQNKPILVVYIEEPDHGGGALTDLLADCPPELRDWLLAEPPLRWSIKPHFQRVALTQIAERVLCLPTTNTATLRLLRVPLSVATNSFDPGPCRLRLYVSKSNPGAGEVVTSLVRHLAWTSSQVEVREIDEVRQLSREGSTDSLPESKFLIVLLRKDTFTLGVDGAIRKNQLGDSLSSRNMDANGEALADELMAILRSEVRFVLIHDVDSCPFQHILESTPRELVVAGLYKSVAVDYIAGRHEEVCAAMLAKPNQGAWCKGSESKASQPGALADC